MSGHPQVSVSSLSLGSLSLFLFLKQSHFNKSDLCSRLQNPTVLTFSPGLLKLASPDATSGQKGEIQPHAYRFSPDIAPV